MHFLSCNSELSKNANKTSRKRQKRTLYFTSYSGYALDVVMSLPLELPAGNTAFCSFVFSSNFFFPASENANGLVPIPFTYIDEPGVNAGSKNRIELPPAYRQFSDNGVVKRVVSKKKTMEQMNWTNAVDKTLSMKEEKESRRVRSLLKNYFMSRRRFYKMMETKMDSIGLNGNDCLLKAICETSEASFRHHNGVIGSVVDVLFLPSASKDEKLPKKYYRAEANGKTHDCTTYSKACPKGVFDYISKII